MSARREMTDRRKLLFEEEFEEWAGLFLKGHGSVIQFSIILWVLKDWIMLTLKGQQNNEARWTNHIN